MPRADVIKCSTEAGNINREPISTFSQAVTFPASGQLSLASLWGRYIEYQHNFASGKGKGGNVSSAGWQVTPHDPTWHFSSHTGEGTCKLLYSIYVQNITTTGNVNER